METLMSYLKKFGAAATLFNVEELKTYTKKISDFYIDNYMNFTESQCDIARAIFSFAINGYSIMCDPRLDEANVDEALKRMEDISQQFMSQMAKYQ